MHSWHVCRSYSYRFTNLNYQTRENSLFKLQFSVLFDHSLYCFSSVRNCQYSSTFLDSPPYIPPPPPPPPCFEFSKTKEQSPEDKGVPDNDEIHRELFNRLNSQNANKKNIGIRKTPESYINQSSSAADLQQWLKAKRFGPTICERLEGINGRSLFNASKTDLESICGEKEGKRLFSQLNLQKSCSGVSLHEGRHIWQD